MRDEDRKKIRKILKPILPAEGCCYDMDKMLKDGLAFFKNNVYYINLSNKRGSFQYSKRIYYCSKCGEKL